MEGKQSEGLWDSECYHIFFFCFSISQSCHFYPVSVIKPQPSQFHLRPNQIFIPQNVTLSYSVTVSIWQNVSFQTPVSASDLLWLGLDKPIAITAHFLGLMHVKCDILIKALSLVAAYVTEFLLHGMLRAWLIRDSEVTARDQKDPPRRQPARSTAPFVKVLNLGDFP